MARVNEACDLSPPFLDYLRVDFIKISKVLSLFSLRYTLFVETMDPFCIIVYTGLKRKENL